MRGEKGQDQPLAWEISTNAADGERVYVVQRGRVVGDTIFSAGGGVPIDMRRLRVDSAEEFNIANRVATESKVGFDALDYELSADGLGNAPIWLIYVRDAEGKDLGEIEISGEDGEVLRRSWFPPRLVDREPVESAAPILGRRALRSYKQRETVADNQDDAGGEPGGTEGTTASVQDSTGPVKGGLQRLGKIFSGGDEEETFEVRQSEDERYRAPKTLRRSP